jgi:hypothetical protein
MSWKIIYHSLYSKVCVWLEVRRESPVSEHSSRIRECQESRYLGTRNELIPIILLMNRWELIPLSKLVNKD